MQVPIVLQPTVIPSALEARVNSPELSFGYATQHRRHRRGGHPQGRAHQGAHVPRVSSVSRPGRTSFHGVPYRIQYPRTTAESTTQLMSEGYVGSPILVSLVFSPDSL